MNYQLFLVGNTSVGAQQFDELLTDLGNKGFSFTSKLPDEFSATRMRLPFFSDDSQHDLKEYLRDRLSSLALDGFILTDQTCLQPQLLIMDMDSTLVQAETIDQIADHAGLMKQVSEITESAMRGELDFTQSLTRRVAMLKGITTQQLQAVHEKLPLTSGAQALLSAAKRNHCKTVLVSGGFSYFAQPIADRIGIDHVYANELGFDGEQLTGTVVGTIVDAEFKRQTLHRMISEYDFDPQRTIAIGDGANDLLMLSAAGLGIAFHGKPKVQQQSKAVINHYGLEALQWLLNW